MSINGTAICLGALLGGVLAKAMPPLFGHRLLALFLLSGVLRRRFRLYFSSEDQRGKARER